MNLRVLLVEDESLVAMLVEDMLADLGCKVVGVGSRLDAGLELAQTVACDAAVLDVNLGGGVTSLPIAETLMRRRIPFLFATGYGPGAVAQHPLSAPVLRKPFTREDLGRSLAAAIAKSAANAR